jgi:hypothetical protein
MNRLDELIYIKKKFVTSLDGENTKQTFKLGPKI